MTGHSKYTDIGPELCTPDFDRLSVPVNAAIVTGLSTIASISVISVHSRYHTYWDPACHPVFTVLNPGYLLLMYPFCCHSVPIS